MLTLPKTLEQVILDETTIDESAAVLNVPDYVRLPVEGMPVEIVSGTVTVAKGKYTATFGFRAKLLSVVAADGIARYRVRVGAVVSMWDR